MPKPAPRKDLPPKASSDADKCLRITAEPGADEAALIARNVLRPSVRAAVTTQAFSKQFGELDLNRLVEELAAQAKSVNDGNLQRPEAMLIAQAHTLEAVFHELLRRAALNMGECLGAAETYTRLALKAQSQCRATLETLATIKNPTSVSIVRQANIAHGPQQVNNAPAPVAEHSCARESENRPNELLEAQRAASKWLDPGTASATIGGTPEVETVGAVNRPSDG
jgi:hypothetical protein